MSGGISPFPGLIESLVFESVKCRFENEVHADFDSSVSFLLVPRKLL